MPESARRDRYISLLTDALESCQYPSVTMLDRIERSIADRETAERYIDLLLETIGRDQYPSPTMLDRVAGLIAILDGVGPSASG
jgi:hypothetical protein